ncbi:hypothetical protein HPB52_011379 [Rhipicephalus sanguineus]|uniref:Cyclin-dependent kinase inhibitor domain-containing protein n=1 Tax=Rhipicephalus sanguineus TaxID=34632 RepID=A0A9D4PGL8_RHISA|nr:hypothetical protein HPB52_011379 [Rhipicephalus sanguineus]
MGALDARFETRGAKRIWRARSHIERVERSRDCRVDFAPLTRPVSCFGYLLPDEEEAGHLNTMGSPHGYRACRRLFDDGEDRATRRTLDKMQEDSSRTWNFDFGRDRPMQGRYQWQRCGDDDKRTSTQWRCWGDASPGSATDPSAQLSTACREGWSYNIQSRLLGVILQSHHSIAWQVPAEGCGS